MGLPAQAPSLLLPLIDVAQATFRFGITFNRRHFRGSIQFGIEALTPRDFLNKSELFMTTISLRIPDSLHKTVDEIVEREGMTLDQFVMLAIAEKASAIATENYLEERAQRGNRDKFLAALSKVPDVDPPDERDRL